MPPEMDNSQLERMLFPPPISVPSSERPQPDWVKVHQDLKGKGVTLSLLWEEYKAENPEGFQYSRFCEMYGEWASKLDVVMRQEHRAGERLFVDYAGQTIPVVDRTTGGTPPTSSKHSARRARVVSLRWLGPKRTKRSRLQDHLAEIERDNDVAAKRHVIDLLVVGITVNTIGEGREKTAEVDIRYAFGAPRVIDSRTPRPSELRCPDRRMGA